MRSHQQNLKPEVQAVLDICEMQGVPVWFADSVYKIEKIELGFGSRKGERILSTQNVATVMRWLQDYKRWNPNASN